MVYKFLIQGYCFCAPFLSHLIPFNKKASAINLTFWRISLIKKGKIILVIICVINDAVAAPEAPQLGIIK